MNPALRDKTAIVGVGNTAFGALYRDLNPERSAYELGAQAFEAEIPYNVAYVELGESARMMTNIVGVEKDDLRCDMPLEPVFEEVTDEVTLLKFRPARSRASRFPASRRLRKMEVPW